MRSGRMRGLFRVEHVVRTVTNYVHILMSGMCLASKYSHTDKTPNVKHTSCLLISTIVMNLSLYKRNFVCLSSITPITHLELLKLTHKLPNTISPLLAYFKFITASSRGVQFAFCSGSKTKKLIMSNIPLKTTAPIAQLVEQLTLKHEVGSLNASWYNTLLFF